MGVLGYFGSENCIWIFLPDFDANVSKNILVNV